ncbi:MAG: penicillin acylase family protein [Deltaproteobacteria bacterium]|nr:penicillin acylase family protein [Candidatus Zymogenaceae bacterium]
MKVIKISVYAIVGIIAVAFIAFQVFFRLALPHYSGTIEVAGLIAPVEVRFDEFAVPHIFAENEHDLFLAQGYITARERMFEMDVTRLAGRGELCTLFGDRTIKEDRYLKTAGFFRTAKVEYAQIPPWVKAAVDAYAEGVNAYLDSAKYLPREYAVLRAEPRPWEPEDTILAAILMGFSLETSVDADFSFYQIGERIGQERLRLLLPSYPDFAPTISPEGAPTTAAGGRLTPALFCSPAGSGGVNPFHAPSAIIGSNWMIFGPAKTTTGAAIFAGSPDLAPQIPAIFYLAHLKGAGYDVIGGAVPGAPGIATLGYNGHIAWSAIASQLDCLDFFVEKVNPDNPDQYLTEKGWRDFEIVQETLKIKTGDGITEEKMTVKISRHGPIISDVDSRAPENCAMMWTGSSGTGAFEGFLKLDRATNYDEFRAALSGVAQPELVMGYADKDGNIGYQSIAKTPIRKKGDGILPAPGWDGQYDWADYVPYDELPHDLNSRAGYFGGFNNQAKRDGKRLSTFYYFERATRFAEIMGERTTPLSPNDVRKLQLESVSVVAKRLVPYLLSAAKGDENLAEYTALFDGWDFSLDKDSAAAALYGSFYLHLLTNTFKDEFPEDIWKELTNADMVYFADQALAKHIGENDFALFDDLNTKDVVETRDDIIKKSLDDAVADLTCRLGKNPAEWRWGKLHEMTFAHPLGEALSFLNLKPIPMSGDFFTIGAANWGINDLYNMTYGGCIRMIVDFSDIEKSTLISPPGQSGQYLSPHYDDLVDAWLSNEQIPMHYTDAETLKDLLVLTPKM